MKLNGKTALIIGATTGIGLETAKLFVAEGARLAITGSHGERLQNAGKLLGPDVKTTEADLRSVDSLRAMAVRTREWTDGLDVVFVNAGISRAGALGSVDEAFFDEHMAVNLRGPFFAIQELTPMLRPGASIVLTTSCLGQMGRPGMAVYAASKAALRSLARTLGAELVARGVRVNAVAPGPVDSGIHAKMGIPPDMLKATMERTAKSVPMGRMARSSEIAKAVLFLACDDSTYMTGHELVVDGGWSAF